MMLVYHFKGRILLIEQKCDTMFEIMNNMVKEMKNIRYSTPSYFTDPHLQTSTASSVFNPEMMLPNNESIFIRQYNSTPYNSAHLGEDDESSDSDSENDTESESQPEPNSQFNKIVVSDNEYDAEEEEETETPIKIINIDDSILEVNDNTEDFTSVTEIVNEEPITVNKVDIDFSASESNNEYLEKSTESVDYKKMDVSYLRTMVITRGLASDTKKLKKSDLIRLLEEAERDAINQEE